MSIAPSIARATPDVLAVAPVGVVRSRVKMDTAMDPSARLQRPKERLDPKSFFRANRKQVINLAWVEGIEPWFSGGLLVKLKGGMKVELSRRQAQDFRERMSL